MQSSVKVLCHGTGRDHHKPRTVAQFRYDDGWGRAYPRGNKGPRDVVVAEDGELSMYHRIACDHPACRRAKPRYVPSGRLHPALDYARDHGGELVLR